MLMITILNSMILRINVRWSKSTVLVNNALSLFKWLSVIYIKNAYAILTENLIDDTKLIYF